MAVHCWASIRTILPRISELPWHHAPEIHIFTAAAPFPSLTGGALVTCVTSADGGRTFGAGTGHRKSNSRRGDGMDEGWLSGGWKRNYKYRWDIENWRTTCLHVLSFAWSVKWLTQDCLDAITIVDHMCLASTNVYQCSGSSCPDINRHVSEQGQQAFCLCLT